MSSECERYRKSFKVYILLSDRDRSAMLACLAEHVHVENGIYMSGHRRGIIYAARYISSYIILNTMAPEDP